MHRHFIASLSLFLSLSAPLPLLELRAADIGGTTVSTNTTLADGDTWSSGNFGINDGAVVNIPNGATLHFTPAADRNLTSNATGTLQIDAGGIFSHATTSSGDNLIVAGAVAILNNGTYEFASGGDLRLSNNGSSFVNAGLIHKTAGSVSGSNDPSYIFPNTTTTGGSFTNMGDITVDAGHLNIAGGSSTGGTFTTASGATLSFSGRWTELTGVSDTSAGGTILISNENPAATTGGVFTAAAATTILNVTGSGLRLGSSGYTAITLDLNGNTLRNDGLLLLSTGTTTVSGAGSFENGSGGTFQLSGGALALNGGDLTNHGAMAVTTGTVTMSGTASVINGATGMLTVSSSGVLTVNTTLTNNGQVTFSGTSSLAGSGSVTNNSQMSIGGTSTISGTVVVTNTAAGTLTLGGGASTLTLNGNNLVNNGTAQYTTDGNVTLTGSGRFINNGTFNHAYGGANDNLIITGTATFENNGTFDLQDRGDIQILSSGVFENNGLVVKSVAGSDPSFIFRDAMGSVVNFIATAGSELRSNAGVMHVAAGGTSDAGALWTADGGHLGVAGQWTGTLTGSSANSGRVRVSTSSNGSVASNLLVGTGGLILDISGDGMFWDQSTIGTQGNTLTNVDTFTVSGSGTKTLNGGGEFVNVSGATFTHLEGTITFADGTILRNQGSFFIPLGTTATGYAGTGSFINDATGTVSWTGGSISVAAPAEFHNQGVLNISGASTHTLGGDGLFSNDAAGVVNWNDGSTLSIGTGATFTNDGTFNVENTANRLFTGAGTFANNGTFNSNITGDSADNIGWSGTGQFINNGLFAFNDNNDYQMEGGTTFTNAATGIIRVNSTINEEAQFFSFSGSGVGTLDNQGTLEVLAGKFRLTTSLSGATFDDNVLTQNDGFGVLTGGTWKADSTATGTASIDLQPFGSTSGIFTIGQSAVVELTGANAVLVQLSSLDQVNGGFYVNQKTFTPAGTLSVGGTGTLGGNGIISGDVLVDGAIQPGATLGTAVGTLSIDGNLSFNSGSQITFQLSAPLGVENSVFDPAQTQLLIDALPDQDPTTQHDALEVSGVLTLDTGMTIHVTDLGVTYAYGQYFDLIDFATLSGISSQAEADAILDLPNIGSFVWDTSLFVSKGIIFVVPEPSRGLFLLLGGAFMILRRHVRSDGQHHRQADRARA